MIDISHVGDDFKDGNAWISTSGAQSKFYSVEGSGGGAKVTSGKSGSWYRVTRLRHIHATVPGVHRVIVTFEDSKNVKGALAMVQYRYDGNPEPLYNHPHGNSKHDTTPYVPTKRTTLQKIAESLKHQSSNQRVQHEVEEESGGFNVHLPCDIPRNIRQIEYERGKLNPPSVDPVLEIINLKESEEEPFIRRILLEKNSPTIILFNDKQMEDVNRFCAPEMHIQASILSSDMTFGLGDFWVVITQYHNLQVLSKRTGRPVSAIGPVMICKTKCREEYTALVQAMTSNMPELKSNLRAFGQDGEEAIFQAFSMEFPTSIGVRDSVHIRRNIEEHVTKKLHLSEDFFHAVQRDIFGTKDVEGLYHTKTRKEFDESLAKLRRKWNALEMEERKKKKMPPAPKFAYYFVKNKSDVIYNYCREVIPVRENLYANAYMSTNATESLNAAIKEWQSYRKEDMFKFVISIKEFIKHQQKELAKPYMDASSTRYMANPTYSKYVKKGLIMPKFSLNKISFITDFKPMPSQKNPESVNNLDLLVGYLSEGMVKSLKEKVGRLQKFVKDGFEGEKIVKSESAPVNPHSITAIAKNGKVHYACDGPPCHTYKTYQVCAHTLAAALDEGKLFQLLEWVVKYGRKKYTPSATAKSSSNAGRKGTQKPRKRASTTITTDSKRLKLAEVLDSDEEGKFSSFNLILHDSLLRLLQTLY